MNNLVIICLVLFQFCICNAQENNQYRIGQKSVAYTDESRNRPLVSEIWYPTYDIVVKKNVADEQREPFKTIESIPNASIPDKIFPLLMVSHGTGGNRFSHTWLIERMVKEGFVVVSVDHYGNTSFNKIPREFFKWWERAIDIQYVLTEVLIDKEIGSMIDSSKIGGVGFSLGGYTNIALAGGYVDRMNETLGNLDRVLPPEFPATEEIIDYEKDSLVIASYNTYKDKVKDQRIKAFFVMAPAIGFGFHSKEQTEKIKAKVFIVACKGDTNTPIKDNALVYHSLIEYSSIYLFDENVNHYVFLNEATDFGKKILPDLTIDNHNVSRKEIHEKTSKLAIEFFRLNL